MIITLVTALLVNWMLLYHELGLGAFLSVVLSIAYLGYKFFRKNQLNRKWWMISSIALAMSLTFIIRDMLIFKLLTFMLLPGVFACYFIDFKRILPKELFANVFQGIFQPVSKIDDLTREATHYLFRGREGLKYIIMGILFAVIFLFVVLPLLISSDLVVKNMAVDVIRHIRVTDKMIFRIVFFFFFASYIYAQSRMTLIIRTGKERVQNINDSVESQGMYTVRITFLSVVNLVYGFYVYVQIRYLFMHAGTLPGGVTYADYAREGFFQLLVVALINIIAVLLLEAFNKGKKQKQKILENMTLSMTVVMAMSAFLRMQLYEKAYGYTSLRMLVFMFLVFLIVFIVLLILYIGTQAKGWLPVIYLFSLFFFIGSSWFNVDGFVAKQNIDRYNDVQKIDLPYLLGLSDDSYAIVYEFIEEHPEYRTAYDTDIIKVYQDKREMHIRDEEDSWQAFNFSKVR